MHTCKRIALKNREVHLITMKEKVSKISLLTHLFLPEKNHRIEKGFPAEIYNVEYLRLFFSIRKSLGLPRAIVQGSGVQALGQGQNGHIVKTN